MKFKTKPQRLRLFLSSVLFCFCYSFLLGSIHSEPWLYSRKSDFFFYSSSHGIFIYWGKAFFGRQLNVYRRPKGEKVFKKINRNVIKVVNDVSRAKQVLGRDYKAFYLLQGRSTKNLIYFLRNADSFIQEVSPKELRTLDLHTRLLGLSFLDRNVRLNQVYEYQLRDQSGTVYEEFAVFQGKEKLFTKKLPSQNMHLEITDSFLEIKWKPLVNSLDVSGYNVFKREKASDTRKTGKIVQVNQNLVKAKYNTFVYLYDPKTIKNRVFEYAIQVVDFWGRRGPFSKFKTSPILYGDVKAPRIDSRLEKNLSEKHQAVVHIEWSIDENTKTYHLQRFSKKQDEWTTIKEFTANIKGKKKNKKKKVFSTLDTVLMPGIYIYRVMSLGYADNTEIFSKPTEVIVADVRIPFPPKEIDIEMEKKGVLLSWDYDPDASLGSVFEIQRKKNKSDYKSLKFVDVKKNNEYLDTTVVGRAFYSYRIQPIRDNGLRGGFSSEIKITTKPVRLPQRIIAFNGVVKKNKICLKWKRPPDSLLNGYILYRSDQEPNDFDELKEFDGNQTEYCDDDVAPNKKYYYAIATKNDVGESKLSSFFGVKLKLPYPPRVTALKGEYNPSTNLVELEWEEPDYDYTKGFQIYRRSPSDRKWARLIKNQSGIDDDSFTDRNVKKGQTYYYTIALVNTAGLEGPKGKLLTILTK